VNLCASASATPFLPTLLYATAFITFERVNFSADVEY